MYLGAWWNVPTNGLYDGSRANTLRGIATEQSAMVVLMCRGRRREREGEKISRGRREGKWMRAAGGDGKCVLSWGDGVGAFGPRRGQVRMTCTHAASKGEEKREAPDKNSNEPSQPQQTRRPHPSADEAVADAAENPSTGNLRKNASNANRDSDP
jgi:hypothetical protein